MKILSIKSCLLCILSILLISLSNTCLANQRDDPLIFDNHDNIYIRLQLNEFKTIKYQGKYYIHIHSKKYERSFVYGFPIDSSVIDEGNYIYNPNTNKVRNYRKADANLIPDENDETPNSKWRRTNYEKYSINYMKKNHPDMLKNAINEVAQKNKEISVSLPTPESEAENNNNDETYRGKDLTLQNQKSYSTLDKSDISQINKKFGTTIKAYDMGQSFIASDEFQQKVQDIYGKSIQEMTKHLWILKTHNDDNLITKLVVAIVPMHLTVQNTEEQYDTFVFISLAGNVDSYVQQYPLSKYSTNKELYPRETLFLTNNNKITYVEDSTGIFNWDVANSSDEEAKKFNANYNAITVLGTISYYSIVDKSQSSSGGTIYTLKDDNGKYLSYLIEVPSITLPIYPVPEQPQEQE